jgi:hypothetical protein
MAAVIGSSLVFSWAYGDMPFSRKFDPSQYSTESRYATFLRQMAQISPDARISAENDIPGHLSERRFIYDYGYEGVYDAEWWFLTTREPTLKYDISLFQAQVASVEAAGYEEVASAYGLALLHKTLSGLNVDDKAHRVGEDESAVTRTA